MYDHPEKVSIR